MLADGVEENIPKAIELLTKSAEQDNLSAIIKLADIYGKGNIVTQDYTKSFYWYERAAKLDSTMAIYHVGLYYYHGYGVKQDEEKGISYIRQAKVLGYKRAENFFKLNNIQ
jgi:TPR repeat protein